MDKAEIEELLRMYDIGKKPLARLLGWGETTIMKYVAGEKPAGEYARKLHILIEDKMAYYELLESNRMMITEVAYAKSHKAVMHLLYATKLEKAAQFVINLAEADIAPGTVQYILFYTLFLFMSIEGKRIFREDIEIKSGGKFVPFPNVYESMKKYKISCIEPDYIELEEKEQEYLQSVFQILNGYSFNAIKAINNYERKVVANVRLTKKISDFDILCEYFTSSITELGIDEVSKSKLYFEKVLKSRNGQ